MEHRAKAKKMLEPTETGDTEMENMVGGGEGRKNESKVL
jgi:hypothetical protein